MTKTYHQKHLLGDGCWVLTLEDDKPSKAVLPGPRPNITGYIEWTEAKVNEYNNLPEVKGSQYEWVLQGT